LEDYLFVIMNYFGRRLDKAISRALHEQDEENGEALAGAPRDMARGEKAASEVSRAADQAFKGLEQIHRALEASGHAENEVVAGTMQQVMGLMEGLKKGGSLRTTLESLLKIPAPGK
jgi:hypothetical protein